MNEGIIIALVAIIGGLSIPIIWFFFDNKSKERNARVMEKALEAGHSPEEVMRIWNQGAALTPPPARKVRFRKGLVLLAIGAALLVNRNLGYSREDADGMVVVGTILLFLGIAFFLSDLFTGAQKKDK
ncbi:MAG: DUF6249 domain-containing protein [Planctomycetota bacterium]|nr:DUF6249 domain-containing protein [Planctomycetota bacterium]MDA1113736.1 DUF6249 domain-containing protein [Planctomycetota bacterium]